MKEPIDGLPCTHDYVFLRTSKLADMSGVYNIHYMRTDTFYCKHCLKYKEVYKEDYAREAPMWYRGD